MLAACGGAAGAPTDIVSLRPVLADAIATIELGINREDPYLASRPVSDRFTMGGNIAARYFGAWSDQQGIAAFRTFFGGAGGVFECNADIEQTLELTDLDLLGTDLAQGIVLDSFSSVHVGDGPPEINPPPPAPYRDLFVFEREGGAWRLILWDEAPALEHDGGEGDST
jgi:hypothetical protein